jgi:NAD(P) transhydrogenase subunit beta
MRLRTLILGFEKIDVTVAAGANYVVNTVVNTEPNTPIAGMPILNVCISKTVALIKRSHS